MGRGERWLAVVLGTALLALPALINGFPLIFPDTTAYLGVAYRDEWTLDRAAFYAFFLKPFLSAAPPEAGLWAMLTLQSVIVATVVVAVVSRLVPQAGVGPVILLLIGLLLFTSAAWHVSQLMPDALTAALILLVWLAASRDVGKSGSLLLWLATGFLALLHYTHIGLFVAASLTALIVACFDRVKWREIVRRATAAGLVVLTVVATHVSIHGLYFNRWSVSPMGSWFLFARLYEDGLVPRWLDRNCGRGAPEPLCLMRGEIPKDSQDILWDDDTPFSGRINEQVGKPESWVWIDMLEEAAMGSIRDEPLQFALVAARGTARQFIHFQALDDECPAMCTMQDLKAMRPALALPLDDSLQLQGKLPRDAVRTFTTPVAAAALILLLPMIVMAWRRRDLASVGLLSTVLISLIANAAMAGALSDVHDRYQSRVVWLAPFSVMLYLLRRRSTNHGELPGSHAGRSRCVGDVT